jgi:hypothetical protein
MNSYSLMLICLSICSSAFSKGLAQQSDHDPVQVAVYYESHNDAAIKLITEQFNNLGDFFHTVTKLDFVPWGRTTYNPDDKTFTCKGGAEECHADRIHACAAYYHSNNSDTIQTLVSFYRCTVQNANWKNDSAEAANQCVNQVDGWVDAYPEIEFCSVMTDDTDISIFLAMRDKTSKLNPAFNDAPIVTINGNQNAAALTDLVNQVYTEYYHHTDNFGTNAVSNKWISLLLVILVFLWSKK